MAIADVHMHTSAQGSEQVKVIDLSSFSRMVDAETFENLYRIHVNADWKRLRSSKKVSAIYSTKKTEHWWGVRE